MDGFAVLLSVKAAGRAEAEEEGRKHELLELERLRKEIEKDRERMEIEERRKLEAQQDFAFSEIEKLELHGINCIRSMPQQLAASNLFSACRKQASLELEQFQGTETERLSRKHLAQDTDNFSFREGDYDPRKLGRNRYKLPKLL